RAGQAEAADPLGDRLTAFPHTTPACGEGTPPGKLRPPPRGSRSMEQPRTASLPRVELHLLLALALARLLLHLLTSGQYGFHRDELAVLDDAGHLAWGYVAYPPLTPLLAHASMALFGDSLTAFRAPSALAQALATLLAGMIA